MKFGRNKSRRRVTLKIIFVWLLSIAMSLPLSLMYSKVSMIIVDNNLRFQIHVNDITKKPIQRVQKCTHHMGKLVTTHVSALFFIESPSNSKRNNLSHKNDIGNSK